MSSLTVRSAGPFYTTEISSRSHYWTADEPVEDDGQDQGPTPFELFLGSIAACAAITARMYARRKGWPLEGVEVNIEQHRLNAEDCPDCTTRKGQIAEITLACRLIGNLTTDQRERILEIAGRCPVKRTIEREVKFRTRLDL